MKKAIIIEDEVNSQKILQTLIERHLDDVQVVEILSSNEETIKFFEKGHQPIDIAFLDINLLDGVVFNSLDRLPEIYFDIIFVTAYEEYAVKAFDYSALAYILKPIDQERLVEAYNRLPKASNMELTQQINMLKSFYINPNTFSKITIAANDGIYFLEMRDIIFLRAEDNYTHVKVDDMSNKIVVSKTIKYYETLLEKFNFFRVHKSYIVNLNHIKLVQRNERIIVLSNNQTVEVARRRMTSFLERLDKLRGRY